ncbi:zinc finger HIT domain-containing protein 2-like [Pollicipes pollicipes]|uniref:zinc finger HIT domain-containing protein 2-like n=1 Tax=Pollicipes pollicipes TaxID=41117 RepID=UPI0018853A49|nr:zinc finger HIT domain-containing protein 2-like [Pollicipes pollicipes]
MSAGTCTFCANGAKYVCPRCGVPYCSLPCYRSSRHERCSEGFYRECVMDSLRREQPDPAVRRRMEETLAREARLQADDEPADSDDSDSEDELSERMRGVDLDDAEAVWSRLTPAERDEFRRQVINALYAYAYLRLLYDGDWSASTLEASDGLCLLSGCLSRGEVMDSGRAAVQAVDFHAGGSAWHH